MNYKFFLILIFINLNSCIEIPIKNFNKDNKKNILKRDHFSNKGFALIYSENLKTNKFINKNINERDLLIFQRNLKKNTPVKITNLVNGRTLLANVGSSVNYPNFYNSVVSIRIAKELDLTVGEPYIEIIELLNNSSFVAKKSTTFDEEKKIATKAPVDEVEVSDLSNSNKSKSKNNKTKRKFNYIIKVADLYFKDSASALILRIKNETNNNKVFVNKLSKSKYRVFLGPFNNINLLQKAYNDIKILEFENIEIIHND